MPVIGVPPTVASDLDLADLAEKDHASLDSVTAAQHHAATVAGDLNLADLGEKDHVSLDSVSAAQHHVGVGAIELTLAEFQAAAASGTAGAPGNCNDNNTASQASMDTLGKYAEFDLGVVRTLNQYRLYGAAGQNGDGDYKWEYYNLVTHAWVEWVTGISTRAGSWTAWDDSGGAIITNKLRITATTIDTQASNVIGELEVKYA